MTGREIFEQAERLQELAANYPHPATRAVLLRAAAMLFEHVAEANARDLIDRLRNGDPQ